MHFAEAKSILNTSGGHVGLNVYRGCTHGCIYCDSRSACYRFSHAFEDVEVKRNAPELLRDALAHRKHKCMIGTGSMSDPYMHAESELELTRRCLDVIYEYGFGAAILTKSDRILRDIDLLAAINERAKCVVQLTLTTLDPTLSAIVEPRVCNTQRRIEVLAAMQARGIPTVVWLTPILPYINDTADNIKGIVDACARTGVKGIICFGMGLTLREGSREHYYAALDAHFPGLKAKYIQNYGDAYMVASPDNRKLMRLFNDECENAGILHTPDECFAFLNDLPPKFEQLSLFG